jgi:hypothetical protein
MSENRSLTGRLCASPSRDEVGEDPVEVLRKLGGAGQRRLGEAHIARLEAAQAVVQHAARVFGHHLDVAGHHGRRLGRQLGHGARNRRRVVADALQPDRKPQHRAHVAQVAGTRQVPRHERVASPVQLPRAPVDRVVAEHGGRGEVLVEREHGVHGVLDPLVDGITNDADEVLDPSEVLLQAFFVVGGHGGSGARKR